MQLVATANSSYHSSHQVLLVRKGVGVDGIQDITPGLRVEVHITGKVPRSGHAIVEYELFKTFSKMKKILYLPQTASCSCKSKNEPLRLVTIPSVAESCRHCRRGLVGRGHHLSAVVFCQGLQWEAVV